MTLVPHKCHCVVDKRSSLSSNLDKYSPLVVNLPPKPIFHSTPPMRGVSPTPPTHPPLPHFHVADVTNIQGLMGNSTYAVASGDLWQEESLSIVECPRENLQFIEKLGGGQFGEVRFDRTITMTVTLKRHIIKLQQSCSQNLFYKHDDLARSIP